MVSRDTMESCTRMHAIPLAGFSANLFDFYIFALRLYELHGAAAVFADVDGRFSSAFGIHWP